MTKSEQSLWKKACYKAIKDTYKVNDGEYDDLFYRVALDYYTMYLKEKIKKDMIKNRS